MKIKKLSSEVINRIAAGEVVQRPASAVKELVENSLDAEAKKIEVYFEAGGKTLQVSDDGTGMTAREVRLALERHATSKIREAGDLDRISTMGFRGEALPSIAAVSRLSIKSKSGDSEAVEVKVEGGGEPLLLPAALAEGTTVRVSSIFYNTPARRKFLKTEATEKKHIIRTVEEISLSRPKVSFLLKEKERKILDLPASSLKERARGIMGQRTASKLIRVQFDNPYIELSGYISSPEISYRGKSRIYIFVNKRPVYSPLIQHAIAQAYRQFIPPNKSPACLLNIKMQPDLVDVNVHPAKREVKFLNQQGVHQIIYKVLSGQLEKTPGAFDFDFSSSSGSRKNKEKSSESGKIPGPGAALGEKEQSSLEKLDLGEARTFKFSPKTSGEKSINNEEKENIYAAFQWKNKYIIGEDGEGIILIDQHTAWERINYEQLKQDAQTGNAGVQGLLIPEIVEVEKSKAHLLSSRLNLLEEYGLLVEEFGPGTFKISGVPASTGKQVRGEEAVEMLEKIVDLIEKSGKKPSPDQLRDELLKLIACRASVKAGDSLNEAEIRDMTERLGHCRVRHRCPHGRPVIIKLTEKEIDKKFSR